MKKAKKQQNIMLLYYFSYIYTHYYFIKPPIMKTKNIFLFLLLSLPTIIFGQLSVRNNAYVYVTNQVLFVTDDVNINEATSNVYLRNEAQLIQGNGITGNSGLGKLSVYQNGTVNEYAYNYWCSPVGNVSANDNFNRLFIPNQQFYDSTGLITSNLASFTSAYNGSSNPLVISNAWLFSYNPGGTYNQWDYLGDTGSLASGYGFTMKGTSGSGSNQLYDFRGKPNNGNIQVNVVASQQTLVGNPYPSALDALNFIHDPANASVITGVLYYWEQAPGASSHYLVDYRGGYASYTISAGGVESFVPATFIAYNGDGTPILAPNYGTGVKAAKRYIPIGQGFMIEGKAGIPVASNAIFKNSHRTFYKQSGVDSFFFRGSGGKNDKSSTSSQQSNRNEYGAIVPNDFKRFRINIDFDNTYARQLLMNFHPTATDGFDYGLESPASGVLNSDAYWIEGTKPYFIQAFNFDTSLTIPLIVKSKNQQPVNFRVFDVQNFDTQPIYIHDIQNNIYFDLRNDAYSINLPAGVYSNRFEITFTQGGVLDVENSVFRNFKVFQNNNDAELTLMNPNNLDIKSVVLFDVLGKQVFKKTALENNSKYVFSTKNLSDGVYIAKVEDSASKMFTKKIIISNVYKN